ncbi:Dihydrolipoyllysine-residue acetyltransferase component of pyruvate dehydrogenase complex [Microbulbifer aggregans]|uniref:Acetyltransferase component of pyruvate dehydrogenase complex n=1 Tax=Microbulbifer aggregans TaxID=1769779 RepID=A0A1C9W3C4_9GAMM|nr:dihydrolipoyllysine-residue acetyltransferase [Microbulbifer aggregans]AOS95642.1 Dihydrolipoyllysine-residue acetyltransferase component of pyruvate dehydrogenase complex [Microbulbifer aggregans]
MAKEVIKVPDLGGADQVDVIEITVAVGDTVAAEDSLIVVEGDKASMDVPAPMAGKILSISVSEGDQVSEGDVIAEIETEAAGDDSSAEEEKTESAEEQAPREEESSASEDSGDEEESAGGQEKDETVTVPDLGGADAVDVIEISVQAGDEVAEGDSLIVVEGDKASMDVPAPFAGTVVSIDVKEGDKVSTGDKLGVLKTTSGGGGKKAESSKAEKKPAEGAPKKAESSESVVKASEEPPAAPQKDHHLERDLTPSAEVYAGPAVRKLARELGVTLNKVKPTGPRNRVTKDDLHAYIKEQVKKAESGAVGVGGGIGIAPMPEIDFSQFGPVNVEPMTKIHKLTAANMSRNWLNVPHVTQFDDADITELEDFRKSMKAEAEKRGVKLTPVPFLLKAAAAALRAEPSFNVSLHNDGEHIVHKDYVHIGMAVDTPKGLMVPVIRDVDKKGLYELAEEATAMAIAARDGKLKPRDMQGACFTISSLGAIGGTGFTPIVNAPEVGILGVSKLSVQPVWNGKEFVPRKMLPLALSYDHRAVNGGDAGRFMTYMVSVLSDVRKLLL